MAQPDQECDSCGHATSGYSRADLEAQGWVWHVVRGRAIFVTCDECERLYAERRAVSDKSLS